MPIHGLFFEANSIQSYILLGGRLRDVVGASHLIDQLCNQTLDRTLEVLSMREGVHLTFVRRAAGAFYAIFDSDAANDSRRARELSAAWSATVRHVCPGLGFNLVIAHGATVFDCVRNGTGALAASKAMPVAPFPLANPLAERSPRTGLPAVASSNVMGSPELVDSAVKARRKDFGKQISDAVGSHLLEALEKVAPTAVQYVFPRNLESTPNARSIGSDDDSAHFPFDGNSHYLAVIHADANGLGQLLLGLIARAAELHALGNRDAAQAYKVLLPKLSKAIEASMLEATVAAIRATVFPATVGRTLPARPLVLAGDDLSMLVRADLAIPFTRHLLQTFEHASAKHIAELASNPDFVAFQSLLSHGLTACAGMMFVKSNHPFTNALHLAEDLCGQAKQSAKSLSVDGPAASAIAFERLSASLESTEQSNTRRVPAWGLGAHSKGLPQLQGLLDLVMVFDASTYDGEGKDKLTRGPLRRLVSTMELSGAEADLDYRRWRNLMSKRDPKRLVAFDAALHTMQCGAKPESSLSLGEDTPAHGASLLPDLIDALAIGTRDFSAVQKEVA